MQERRIVLLRLMITYLLFFSFARGQGCYYNVTNCQKCSTNPPVVPLSQFNVTCVLQTTGKYVWNFVDTNTKNTTFVTNGTITSYLPGNSACFQTDFALDSAGVLSIEIAGGQAATLLFNSSVSVGSGTIQLLIDGQLPSGVSTYTLFSFNSAKNQVSPSQVRLCPTYRNFECDTISSQIMNSLNSLSVTLNVTVGNKCVGYNSAATLAYSFFLLLILVILSL